MTIIEAALGRLKEGEGGAPGARRPLQRRSGRTLEHAGQTDTGHRYRAASLDSTIMERHCILTQTSDRTALRAYKILRTRLLHRLASNGWQTLAVTGTQMRQGKTLTAINLAITLSQDVHTPVFLVDLDLYRPSVAAALGMNVRYGIGDYLCGAVEADEVIYESDVPRLAIVPNLHPVENSSELLRSERMTEFLRVLTSSAPRRLVIFDMPPLMLSDDVLAFAPSIDGVLLVATEGVTRRGTLESAKEVLAEMNLIGVVLNRSAERTESYYY